MISSNDHIDQLVALADHQLKGALSVIPRTAFERVGMFIDLLRAIDFWTVFQQSLPPQQRLSGSDVQILQWGWNLAAAHTLTALPRPGGIPIREVTDRTASFATTLLHQFGRAVLLRRAADMLRYGFLRAEETKHGLVLRKTEVVASQMLDVIEFSRIAALEEKLEQSESYSGWNVVDFSKYEEVQFRIGNYMTRRPDPNLSRWKRPEIDDIMRPLIFPWDSGYGMMMGYGALPQVDDHFLADAAELAHPYRDEAGIHPEAIFDDTTGADVSAIAIFMASLHMKHVRFAHLAAKNRPEINMRQSITIWEPEGPLEEAIADYTGFELNRVKKGLRAITLLPEDVTPLKTHTTPFRPPLISLGNGFILRPVSSLAHNPLAAAISLLEWRSPAAAATMTRSREEWMRMDVYGMFQGTRYATVPGAVKLREGDRVITDIDAAVFDRVSGELALIQVKWQDYLTNDVRKLRSKSTNLVKELDAWTEAMKAWISCHSLAHLGSCLRLPPHKAQPITKVFLFAISRSIARTGGYGIATKQPSLAVANWPQFKRVRCEIGPSKSVFGDIHQKLRQEYFESLREKPIPVEIKAAGKTVRFEDLWTAVET